MDLWITLPILIDMEQTLHRLRYDIDPNLYRREYKKWTSDAGQAYGRDRQQKYQKDYLRRKGRFSKQ